MWTSNPQEFRAHRYAQHEKRLARARKKAAGIFGKRVPGARDISRLMREMAAEAWREGRRLADGTLRRMPQPNAAQVVRREVKAARIKLVDRSDITKEIQRLIAQGERARRQRRQRRYQATEREEQLQGQAVARAKKKAAALRERLEAGEEVLRSRVLGELRRDVVDALADIDWAVSQRAERERYAEAPGVSGLMAVTRQDDETTPM